MREYPDWAREDALVKLWPKCKVHPGCWEHNWVLDGLRPTHQQALE